MTSATGKTLHLLSGGAAQGLVRALEARFLDQTGVRLDGRFGAVGAMKEALVGGAPCDVMIVTAPMVDALAAEGRLVAASKVDLGRVATGVAVRAGTPLPSVDSADSLRAALLAADRIYFPDPERATAGIHFASVLQRLGIDAEVAARRSLHPNGATAMRALAESTDRQPIGCTQVTEILYTAGVRLAGLLPTAFALATVYSAAVTSTAADPALAARFVALLADDASRELRIAGGFEI